MRVFWIHFFSILLVSFLGLTACSSQDTAQPLIMVASPQAPDASFMTYDHPSGVFSLRVPPTWIPDELPTDNNGVRMQFTAVETNNRVVRLSLNVVNTGQAMTAEAFMNAVNAYQPPEDLSVIPWHPNTDPAAMRDGSVRLTGVRDYPTIGARALNIFLQGNGSYFSALEADVTGATPETIQTLMAVINTYQVNTEVGLGVGNVAPPGVTSASGIIGFEQYAHWEDENGGFNITGQILNNAEKPLDAVRLTAYLFDMDGNQLAERSDVLAYDILKPEQNAPFRLRFDTGRPSTAVRYELHAAARTAQDETTLNFLGRENFLVGEDEAFFNTNGNLTIAGLVQNESGRLVENVKIVAAIYNEAGEIVGSEASFITQEQLLPGEATPFELTVYDLGGNPFRYTIIAQGSPAS